MFKTVVDIEALFTEILNTETAYLAGEVTSADFDNIWAKLPAHRVTDYQEWKVTA